MSLQTSIRRSDGWARPQTRRGCGLLSIIVGLCAVLAQAGLGAAQALAQCTEEQKLVVSEAVAGNWLVMDTAIDGDTIVVGGWGNDSDPVPGSGAAIVFGRSAGVWTEQAKLTASAPTVGDSFGHSVAFDGDTVVVGAPAFSCPVDSRCSSAYVFHFNGSSWVEEQKLTASDAVRGDRFGKSVAVDGDTIVVGAGVDSVYIFRFDGSIWVEERKLTPYGTGQHFGFKFGEAVAVDGDTVVVGSPNTVDRGARTGSAFVFVRSAGIWTEQAKLLGSYTTSFNNFGSSVDVDGDTVVVGAALADDGDGLNRSDTGFNSGEAYVFVRLGGVWVEQANLTAFGDRHRNRERDFFGNSVAVAGDTIVVGAPGDGWASTFVRHAGVWTGQANFTGSETGRRGSIITTGFGFSLALDGDTAAVVGPSPNGLSVYVFRCSPGDANGDDPGDPRDPGKEDPGDPVVPPDPGPDDPVDPPDPDPDDPGVPPDPPPGICSAVAMTGTLLMTLFGLISFIQRRAAHAKS